MTTVAQIPLRDPATLANQALTVDHISNGRLEIGLGIGVKGLDPSYRMIGLPDWSNKERTERLGEYLEVVDMLLSQEVSSYQGKFYELNGAVMSPRPIQNPRPPIMVAAMGPRMLRHRRYKLDLRHVDKSEVMAAKKILKRMNYDRRFKLTIDQPTF